MGINWMNPAVIGRSTQVFSTLALFLAGVATWDIVTTLWFEWQFFTRKRAWRWPMLIYMVARISMLIHIYSATMNANPWDNMPCTPLTFLSKFGHAMGTWSASLILALRTRAVWRLNLKVTIIMGLLWIGQVVIWAHGFQFQKSVWNARLRVCQVIETPPQGELIACWVYTMVFDLIVLLLCTYRLASYRFSTLNNLLLRDGIGYFCAAWIASLIQTVFVSLNLNPLMNIMGLPLALVTTVIASTTIFRNVFTAYDSFASDTTGISGSSQGQISEGPVLRTGGRILFSHTSRNDIPLGEYKSQHDIGQISVHRMVEVDDTASSRRMTFAEKESDTQSPV